MSWQVSSAIKPLRCDPQLSCFIWTTSFLCSDRVGQRETSLSLSLIARSALSSFIAELKQKDHRETTDPAAATASQAHGDELRARFTQYSVHTLVSSFLWTSPPCQHFGTVNRSFREQWFGRSRRTIWNSFKVLQMHRMTSSHFYTWFKVTFQIGCF